MLKEQERYTYDEKSCPQRITDIREVIVELDNQIDEELRNETTNVG